MKRFIQNEQRLVDPTVKEVLKLLGIGTFVTASLIIPTLPIAAKPIIDFYKKKQREREVKEWSHFNQYRLRQTLKRLYRQKEVEISEEAGETRVILTEKGKHKYFKYKMEEMMIEKPPKWDRKWRLIIYDVQKEKKLISDAFRRFLRKMEIFKLQRSVYLTPFPCLEQIEFLRQFYGLGEEVLYLEVQKIENEYVYRDYFGV